MEAIETLLHRESSADTEPSNSSEPSADTELRQPSETSEGIENSRLLTHLRNAQVSEHGEAAGGTEAVYPDKNVQSSEALPPSSSASARITMHELITPDEQPDLSLLYRPISGLPVMGHADQMGPLGSQSVQGSGGYSSGAYIYADPGFAPQGTGRLSLSIPRSNPTDLG